MTQDQRPSEFDGPDLPGGGTRGTAGSPFRRPVVKIVLTVSVVVALVLGFAAGRLSAPAKQQPVAQSTGEGSASPALTATQPVTATPTAQPSSTQLPNPPATGVPSADASATAGNGGLLGSYTIDITPSYTVPIGPTKPTQAQFDTVAQGDLQFNDVTYHLYPISPDTMVSLAAGTTPTYQSCSAATVFVDNIAPSAPGISLCVVEPDRLAGITITAVTSSYVTLQISVWQYIH